MLSFIFASFSETLELSEKSQHPNKNHLTTKACKQLEDAARLAGLLLSPLLPEARMRRPYKLLIALVAFFVATEAQITSQEPPTATTPWNGDQTLCPSAPTTPSPTPKPMPSFAKRAEFAIERIQYEQVGNITLPGEKSLIEYIYDYDANSYIMVTNKNGQIDVEYYYYSILKKSTYFLGEFCVVSDILQNQDMDGASAVQLPNGTWHIRPLNEFLLFSNLDPSRRMVIPVYKGQDVVRGIPVDIWQSCYFDEKDFRTVRRIWALARKGVVLPTGIVGDEAVPIQAIISASYDLPNGTKIVEVDEVFNVYSYRPGILENQDTLAPPKGAFCKNKDDQNLLSLSDVGIEWPDHFSVRVETSSSRSPEWQRFHLRYNLGRNNSTRVLRYDYMPPGAEDYQSIIHDYTERLTYTIDRRTGTCRITRKIDIPDVSPLRDPIEFFIKHENRLIFNPPQKAWEFNGYRSCRGDAIKCTIMTTSFDDFPAMIDSDTGRPSNRTWAATNVEYGWSIRAPLALPPPDSPKGFDYPVTLFMKLYRFEDPLNPTPANFRSENIEYEFYEMSKDRSLNDFDIASCYRTNDYDYMHLFFNIKADIQGALNDSRIIKSLLDYQVERFIMNKTGVKYLHVAEVQIEQERVGNVLTVFFTLLGQTRDPDTGSVVANEPTASQARDSLRAAIDAGEFQFSTRLADNTSLTFTGEKGSLKPFSEYKSTYEVKGKVTEVIEEGASGGAQATAIVVGVLCGLLVGLILAAVIRVVMKKPMPALPTSMSNPLPPINFSARNTAAATSKPTSDA